MRLYRLSKRQQGPVDVNGIAVSASSINKRYVLVYVFQPVGNLLAAEPPFVADLIEAVHGIKISRQGQIRSSRRIAHTVPPTISLLLHPLLVKSRLLARSPTIQKQRFLRNVPSINNNPYDNPTI
jgi:hypothetical protein